MNLCSGHEIQHYNCNRMKYNILLHWEHGHGRGTRKTIFPSVTVCSKNVCRILVHDKTH